MRRGRISGKVLAFLCAFGMLLSVVCGCTDGRQPGTDPGIADSGSSEHTGDPSDTSETEGQGTGYALPEGAESPYALYRTVTGFLNGGFHYDTLRKVYDKALTQAFYSKAQEKAANIFTYGMDMADTCQLMSELKALSDRIGLPLDEDGEFDDDLIKYDVFANAFPEAEQERIRANRDRFERYIETLYSGFFHEFRSEEGRNPFRTGQTAWTVEDEEDIVFPAYDDYDDFDEELKRQFPDVRMASLGRYEEDGDVVTMSYLFTEAGGKYYFLGFASVIGSAG